MKYGTKFVHTTLSSLEKHVASLFFMLDTVHVQLYIIFF